MPATSSAVPTRCPTSSTPLRRHCADVGRDPALAEGYAAVEVDTLVTSSVGPDPAGSLESTFGPAMDRLATIETRGR